MFIYVDEFIISLPGVVINNRKYLRLCIGKNPLLILNIERQIVLKIHTASEIGKRT